MTIRSYLVATSARFSAVAGSPNRPVGLSGTVASTEPIRRPAARAPSIARTSEAGSQMPPSPAGVGTKCGRAPIRPAWAA
jgi:hypothetical protein